MSEKLTFEYTHKGLFGFCPVFIGLIDTEGPVLCPRHPWLKWLYDLSTWFVVWGMHMTGNYVWPIRVTGELPEPREM